MKLRLLLLIPLAHQDVPERCAEGLVTQGVAHGVDRAVDVTQPVTQSPESFRDAVLTESVHQHHDVVRQPGGDEGKQDGAERPRCFLLVRLFFVLTFTDLRLGLGGEAFGHGCVFYRDASR